MVTKGLGMGLLCALLALPACFDVRTIAPGDGTFKIDNFEDGDTLPATSLFDRWQCFTFNPALGQDPDQTVTCGLESPGDQSTYGMSTAFKLHDGTRLNADGTPAGTQYAGASLMIFAYDAAVDLSGFVTLVFDMKVEFGEPPLPMTHVDVQLGCNSVAGENAANTDQTYFDLIHNVPFRNIWQTFALSLTNFTQRSDELNHFANGPQSCLKVIDTIRFEVVEPLTFGQSGSGVFHIDDVHLERNQIK